MIAPGWAGWVFRNTIINIDVRSLENIERQAGWSLSKGVATEDARYLARNKLNLSSFWIWRCGGSFGDSEMAVDQLKRTIDG